MDKAFQKMKRIIRCSFYEFSLFVFSLDNGGIISMKKIVGVSLVFLVFVNMVCALALNSFFSSFCLGLVFIRFMGRFFPAVALIKFKPATARTILVGFSSCECHLPIDLFFR